MKFKLFLPAILITVIVLGLSQPVSAQPTQSPNFIISTGLYQIITPSSINVESCTEFVIFIWIVDIDDIPGDYYLHNFTIAVWWSSSLMELADGSHLTDPEFLSWHSGFLWNPREYVYSGGLEGSGGIVVGLEWEPGNGGPVNYDSPWLALEFHCLGAGTSDIEVSTYFNEFYLRDGAGNTYQVPMEPVSITCNQQAAPQPPSHTDPVGGELYSVNKLAVLAPYLALMAVAAVATVCVVKSRRRA